MESLLISGKNKGGWGEKVGRRGRVGRNQAGGGKGAEVPAGQWDTRLPKGQWDGWYTGP